MTQARIQSRNITNLCSELGFGPGIDGRDAKVLTDAVTKFWIEFTKKGNFIGYKAPDSPAARYFATEFCKIDGNAERFWKTIPGSPWPFWRSDKSKYVFTSYKIADGSLS